MERKLSFAISCIFFLAFTGSKAQAPAWKWAKSYEGVGYAVGTDAARNTYVAGGFGGPTITFDTITFNLSSPPAGHSDIFIVKYDTSGKAVWARSVGGSQSESVRDIAVDAAGNCYVAGTYMSSSINFGGFNLFSAPGSANLFVVKYDNMGNVVWAKSAAGEVDTQVIGICLDAGGNCYVTGSYLNTLDFGAVILPVATSFQDIFIAKYNSSGNLSWAKKAGGTSVDAGSSIAADNNGNIYVLGLYRSTSISFGSIVLTNAGADDIFLAKYDTAGNALWGKSIGGNDYESDPCLISNVGSYIEIAGNFYSSSITFPASIPITITNIGTFDGFVARFDTSGNTLWAKNAGSGFKFFVAAKTDAAGNGYFFGFFYGPSFTFASTVVNITFAGHPDMFLLKYDQAGNEIWAKKMGGSHDDAGYDMSVDPAGNCVITGTFHNPNIVFNSITLTTSSTSGCVAYLPVCSGPPSYPAPIISSGGNEMVCPGESRTYSIPIVTGAVSYTWTAFTGATITTGQGTNTIGITYTSAFTASSGTLKVKAVNSCGSSTQRTKTISRNNPAAIITPFGPTTFCSGTTPLTLTTGTGTGYTYKWKKSSNYIAGAVSNFYQPVATATYKVEVTNPEGCSKLSDPVSVTVYGLPSSTITAQGPTTFCAGDSVILLANSGTGLSYQWKNGSGNIPGATNQAYTAKTAGTYKVIVTNSHACSKVSSGKVITINCREQQPLTVHQGLQIIPNPSNGEFALLFYSAEIQPFDLTITDASGREVKQEKIISVQGRNEFFSALDHSGKGIYFVKLVSSGEVLMGRITIQ